MSVLLECFIHFGANDCGILHHQYGVKGFWFPNKQSQTRKLLLCPGIAMRVNTAINISKAGRQFRNRIFAHFCWEKLNGMNMKYQTCVGYFIYVRA